MTGEQHLVIDWIRAFSYLDMEDEIDAAGLEITHSFALEPYPHESKLGVMLNFYHQSVDDFRGAHHFIVYLVNDPEPIYEERHTSKGFRFVNSKMFDLKQKLRGMIEGTFSIHTTDNIQETRDNLRALGLYKHYNRKEFENLDEVFDCLNNEIEYVVLRNFENYPDMGEDVDLLCRDYFGAKRILDGDSVMPTHRYEDGGYRILNNVLVGGKEMWFDLRHVGDDYYCEEWEEEILQSRVKMYPFYTPDETNHLFSLMYHILVHKDSTDPKYDEKAGITNRDTMKHELNYFLKDRKYQYVIPSDKSVGHFYKGAGE